MGNTEMMQSGIKAVVNYYNTTEKLNNGITYLKDEDVCVTWFAKELQNYKMMLSTPWMGNEYYEYTYNGDKNEAYLDVYNKIDNIRIEIQ